MEQASPVLYQQVAAEIRRAIADGQWFTPTFFAFGPTGAIYADDLPGDIGFEAHQQLLSVSDGQVRLTPRAPTSSRPPAPAATASDPHSNQLLHLLPRDSYGAV
jgi:hypothetical protein